MRTDTSDRYRATTPPPAPIADTPDPDSLPIDPEEIVQQPVSHQPDPTPRDEPVAGDRSVSRSE
jgi:hypothetical protein